MSGVRSLALLSSNASTSRVLNLSLVPQAKLGGYDESSVPFFRDPLLNRAILIKHRLRPEENDLFGGHVAVATKIVFPLDRNDLKVGGRSIMVNQSGFKPAICALLGKDEDRLHEDFSILDLLDELPSLDPFLVREQLRRNNHTPDECYFSISPADAARMHSFAGNEIGELIKLAFSDGAQDVNGDMVKKLVDALLSSNADFRLDPLRQTLGLEGEQFTKGIFSWKGFLYYKWQFSEHVSNLRNVGVQMDQVKVKNRLDSITRERLDHLRKSIKSRIRETAQGCQAVLTLYDDSFQDLVKRGNTAAFRKFLLDAPLLFVDLGHAMGMISHISSFWRFRFKEGAPLIAEADEFVDILSEFDRGLAPKTAVT